MIINTKKGGASEISNAAACVFDVDNNLIGVTLYGPVITGSYPTVRSCSVAKPVKRIVGSFSRNPYLTSVPSEADLEYVSTSCFVANTALTEVNMSSLTSVGHTIFQDCTGLLKASFPKLTTMGQNLLRACPNLQTVQIGSIGNTVTNLDATTFIADSQSGLTITVYTYGGYVDRALANARRYATNATVIIKASADTAYGATLYAAGDIILTDAPSV